MSANISNRIFSTLYRRKSPDHPSLRLSHSGTGSFSVYRRLSSAFCADRRRLGFLD